ncbi:MAG: hypothetical protein Ct9H90mP18_05460 [Gammaproteobacteria bacterium]|nr:MAG: hypothetical protein Ct9H90mP18_05460 [Gammaproteobacteria bacterium]
MLDKDYKIIEELQKILNSGKAKCLRIPMYLCYLKKAILK